MFNRLNVFVIGLLCGLHADAQVPTPKTAPPAQPPALESSGDENAADSAPGNEPKFAVPESEPEPEFEPEPPADGQIESDTSPDDAEIEYADEAEREEQERNRLIEEQKKRARQPKPPVDEPMPLIPRQRQTVEYPNQQAPKRIRHPYAAKGLTKITKDGIYIYKVKESDQTRASSVRFGTFSPTKLENPDTGTVFEDFYESGNLTLLYDYEWQFFRKFGKLGLKVGTGVAMASGNGRFKNQTLNGELEPKEKFTFAVLPNTAGAIVRLQFWPRQILVPYGEGGGAVFAFGEMRDDGKTPKLGAAFGGYFAAGVAFNLRFLDPLSMLELDREYSINNVYLTAEYRYHVGAGNFDFTSECINGGITVEF